MPGLTTFLATLFLSTLPIIPHPSIERGHFRPPGLTFPAALTVVPRHLFTTQTPRSWEVARCVQYLVWAWGMVTCVEALRRTIERVKRGSLKLDEGGTAEGDIDQGQTEKPSQENKTKDEDPTTPRKSNDTTATTHTRLSVHETPISGSRYISNPLLITLALYAISWRLATTLILPNLPGAWKWPFDATTLLGIGTGLACSWAEVWRLLRIAGFAQTETGAGAGGAGAGGSAEGKPPGTLYRLLHALMSGHRLLLAIRVISATIDRSGEIKPLPGLYPTA